MAAIVEEVRPAVEAGRPLYFGHIAAPELLSELADELGVEEKLVAEIGGVVGSHVGRGPMAWPTSRPVEAAGIRRRATTLPDLRSRPVTELPGVGPRIEAALGELGVSSLADMVSHYPSRHEDLSNVKRISDLRVGEKATVVGTRRQHAPRRQAGARAARPASPPSSTTAPGTSRQRSGAGAGC